MSGNTAGKPAPRSEDGRCATEHFDVFGALALLLVVVLAYLPALQGGYIWDDDSHVLVNSALRDLPGLWSIWTSPGVTPQYYPLVHTTFWIEYQLWGLNPVGFHLINVILHALSTTVLWFLLRRLSLRWSWFAAAIFALHPVQVESVAWITERKNVLSGLFYFLALLIFLRSRVQQHPAGGSDRSADAAIGSRDYALALVLFVCALLSKSVTVTLPAAALLILWWKRGRLSRRDILGTVPFFAIGAGMALVTIWMEKNIVGAHGAAWALSFPDRVLVAGRAIWFYAAKLLWPSNLTFIYPRWLVDTGVWWQWFFPATALLAMAALWLGRSRLGRGPLAGVLFFVGTLVPALGFVDFYPMRYSFVADHFQYLASIGLIAVVTGGAAAWVAPGTSGGPAARTTTGVLLPQALLLAILGMLTWRQCGMYQNVERLWLETLARNPGAIIAYVNLGIIRESQGDVPGAMAFYSKAVQLGSHQEEPYNNLGVLLARQGRLEEAVRMYYEALRVNPDYAGAHRNLALTLSDQGKVSEAQSHYLEAIRIDPDEMQPHNNLGVILMGQGRLAEASFQFQEAIRIDPNDPVPHDNLGRALARQGKLTEATASFSRSVRIDPDFADAHYDLGLALSLQGRVAESRTHFAAAQNLRSRGQSR